MIRLFLALLGLVGVITASAHAAGPAPYTQAEANYVYNLLFCDDPSLFKPKSDRRPVYWESALYGPKPDATTIRRIAYNKGEESRVRALAYDWLRRNKQKVHAGELLGVIVEVPLAGGLDVLAAYADGRVRYINQSGKLALFERGPAGVEAKAKALVASAQPAIQRIGAWEGPRLPPPTGGNVRITFLVSDGLYLGEGPFGAMQRDPIAAPVIKAAGELLELVVDAGTK